MSTFASRCQGLDLKRKNSPAHGQAKVAQLVERNLAKVKVAGSRPVFRSKRELDGLFFVFASFVTEKIG